MLLVPIFVKLEPAFNLFLPLLQVPLIKVKAQFLLWQRFCRNHSDVVVWKRAYKLCQPDIFPAIIILSRNTSIIFCNCRTIVFNATTDKIRSTKLWVKLVLDGVCLMYIFSDISISAGAITKSLQPHFVK